MYTQTVQRWLFASRLDGSWCDCCKRMFFKDNTLASVEVGKVHLHFGGLGKDGRGEGEGDVRRTEHSLRDTTITRWDDQFQSQWGGEGRGGGICSQYVFIKLCQCNVTVRRIWCGWTRNFCVHENLQQIWTAVARKLFGEGWGGVGGCRLATCCCNEWMNEWMTTIFSQRRRSLQRPVIVVVYITSDRRLLPYLTNAKSFWPWNVSCGLCCHPSIIILPFAPVLTLFGNCHHQRVWGRTSLLAMAVSVVTVGINAYWLWRREWSLDDS